MLTMRLSVVCTSHTTAKGSVDSESHRVPFSSLFSSTSQISLADGVLGSRKVHTLFGRGLEAGESDAPVNFHPEQ